MSLRTSAAYVATRLASGALAMATLALVVRGLGPERYGQLTLGLAAAAAVTLVLFNPINATLARFYGEAHLRAALARVLGRIQLGVGGFFVLLAAFAEGLGASNWASGVLLAAALMALAQGAFDFSGQYLAASQQSSRYSLQFLAKSLLSLALCALALHQGGGAAAVLAAMAGAFVLAALLAGNWRRASSDELAPITTLASGDSAALLRFAGPLLLTSLLGYLLLWGDRYVLERLVPLAELGRYSAVMDLALQTLGLIFSGLCTAWYPRLVLAWGAKDRLEAQRLYERYAALGLAVCLPAGLGFALLLPDVLPLLYGEAFAHVSPALLIWVSAAAVLAGVKAYYLDQPLLLARRVWLHALSIGVAALSGLLLAIVLVPGRGVAGAALGLLLGQGLGALVSVWGGRGVLRHRLPMNLLWPPLLAAGAMLLVLSNWSAFAWMGVLLKCASGAAVYAGVMWLADFDGVRARFLSSLKLRSCTQQSGSEVHVAKFAVRDVDVAPTCLAKVRAGRGRRILLFANTDWFLFNFKLSLAQALRARGDQVILLSPPGEYGPRLRELGFRWEALPVSRSGVNPLAELVVIRRVARLYRELQPDLVHHFTIKCVIYGSFAARRAGVRAIVNSVTGLGFALLANTPKARLIRPVVLALYRLALGGTQVIFQNHDNRDTLAAYGVLNRSGVQVVAGDGIDTAYFAPVSAEAGAQNPDGGFALSGLRPPVVLMMARLLYSKGVADFVAAAALVRKAMPQARFLLAGEPDPGNPESVSEADLAVWRATGQVEFLGQRSDVLALNQSASVVVLASTQGEGIPRALLEGAACAVPMVATDVPGCREVVVEGETGCLVPAANPEKLAAAVLRLLGDADLNLRMGLAARHSVEQRFSDQVVIAQTCAVYAKASGGEA